MERYIKKSIKVAMKTAVFIASLVAAVVFFASSTSHWQKAISVFGVMFVPVFIIIYIPASLRYCLDRDAFQK